jgi:hypothetical protein
VGCCFYGLVSDFNARRNGIDDHQILSESLQVGSVVQQFEKFTSLPLWCSLGGFMDVCHQSILIIFRTIPPQIYGELTESRKDCFPSRRGKLLKRCPLRFPGCKRSRCFPAFSPQSFDSLPREGEKLHDRCGVSMIPLFSCRRLKRFLSRSDDNVVSFHGLIERHLDFLSPGVF